MKERFEWVQSWCDEALSDDLPRVLLIGDSINERVFRRRLSLYRHFIDEEKPKSTEFRYGKITKRVVIYRGENTTLENGIEYGNAEEYLKSLV